MMKIADIKDINIICAYDKHISRKFLEKCISDGLVYIAYFDGIPAGIMRYSYFWQIFPMLDLIYIDEKYRGKGFGTQMMMQWEDTMRRTGFEYTMTSTQEDETAWRFYEKLGYVKSGSFLPPEQQARELVYFKALHS